MSKREKVLLIILAIVFVAGCVAIGYAKWSWISEKLGIAQKNSNSNSVVSNANTNTNTNQNSNVSKVTPIVDPGVTWVNPIRLDDLGLFQQIDTFDCSVAEAEYYKVANLKDGGEIILTKMVCGMGSTSFFRFRKDTAGKYHLIIKNSSETDGTLIDSALADYGTKTALDNSTVYGSISSPDAITDGEGNIFQKKWSEDFFTALSNAKEITQTSYGSIYEILEASQAANASDISLRSFYLKHADATVTNYELAIKFMSDDQIPNVTISGSKNSDKYFTSIIAAHCGAGSSQSSIVLETAAFEARLAEAGAASDGSKIYYLKNSSDPITKAGYETYKVGRDTDAMSYDSFATAKPAFFWQDPFGRYIIFFNQKYAPLAECGKPVIYLYPTEPTAVSVKVDVNISKSEPKYNQGWNVLAWPNGKLQIGQKAYDYLFWEGKGKEYPVIKDGFIIKSEEVKATLTSQMIQLGLNDQEIADFLEFWLPKMPTTPYVRLTWLGTSEMNRLAPLEVTPKPDTVIRIFLDFAGLENPININPQRLSHIERKGFTLIEWGGLLK